MIEGPEAPIAAEELQKTAGIRDLVNLSRELEKQARGEPFNELIVAQACALLIGQTIAIGFPAGVDELNIAFAKRWLFNPSLHTPAPNMCCRRRPIAKQLVGGFLVETIHCSQRGYGDDRLAKHAAAT